MVGTIQHHAPGAHTAASQGQGKRMEAVGQQAKVAVAAAREAGAELPKNAQGVAASAVARGIDPASLFAARVSDDTVPVAEGGGVPVTPEDADVAGIEAEDVEVEAHVDDGEPVVEPDYGNTELAADKVAPVVSEDPVLALFTDSSDEASPSE